MDQVLSQRDVETLGDLALVSGSMEEMAEHLHTAVRFIEQQFEPYPETRALCRPLHDNVARLQCSLTRLAFVMMRFSVSYESMLTTGGANIVSGHR